MGLFDNPLEKGQNLSDRKKYIDDFELVETTDEKGRVRKRAVYKGTWTVLRPPVKTAQYKLWGALGMAAALAVVYVRMLLLTHLTSGQLLAMVPLLIGLFPGMYLLMGALSLPFRGRPMRRDQYMHSFIRASRSAVAVIVCAAAGLIASIIYRAVNGDWSFFQEDRLFIILCLVSAALASGVLSLLRTVEVAERPNETYNKNAI